MHSLMEIASNIMGKRILVSNLLVQGFQGFRFRVTLEFVLLEKQKIAAQHIAMEDRD